MVNGWERGRATNAVWPKMTHLRAHDGGSHEALSRDLLRFAVSDVLSEQLIFGRADIAAADDGFRATELAAGDESDGGAARTRHDGYVGILRVSELGLILEEKHGSGIHTFRDPFFQELQVG